MHTYVHCNDSRQITFLELKLKSIVSEGEEQPSKHILTATASAAFYKTTLLADSGRSLKTIVNPNRPAIVNMKINFSDDNTLTGHDIANFVEALQNALDTTTII